jgi:hypothetical protein
VKRGRAGAVVREALRTVRDCEVPLTDDVAAAVIKCYAAVGDRQRALGLYQQVFFFQSVITYCQRLPCCNLCFHPPLPGNYQLQVLPL